MRCKRCSGLMIVELCPEEEFKEKAAGRGALRCINCGAMVNERMLRNLAAQHAGKFQTLRRNGPRVRHSGHRFCMEEER